MPDFSVITCISKPDIYHSCLLDSVNQTRGKFDIEIIPIINNNNLYSASNALNIGIDAAKSNVLIFAHQDIRLLENWFELLEKLIDEMPEDWGILGSAGISIDFNRVDIGRWGGAKEVDTVAVGTVYDSDEAAEPYWNGIKDLTKSHCADECLFVLNKSTGLRFDTQFTGFHFYGVDICLQARAAAYSVYCAHLPIIHYGQYSASFTGDKKYWVYLRYLHNKWRLQFPEMLGTHMHWAPVSEELHTDEIEIGRELTSYISLKLENDCGTSVGIKALGIEKAKFTIDRHHHFIED